MIRTFALAAAAALAAGAASAQTSSFDGIVGVFDQGADGNLEMNGVSITAAGPVGGWLEMNGATIDVDADVVEWMELNGANVEMRGSVGGWSEVNAGNADIEGAFQGPVEVNAGSVRLAGVYADTVEVAAGRTELAGVFNAELDVRGEGREGLFRRSDRSELVVSGTINAPARLCGHVVSFRGATLNAEISVRADREPDLSEVDAARVSFTPRDGGEC